MSALLNLDEAKQKLAQLADEFTAHGRGKQAALAALKPSLIKLRNKGASCAVITAMVTQSGVAVSADTVRRYLIRQGLGGRRKEGEKATEKGAGGAAPKGFRTIQDEAL